MMEIRGDGAAISECGRYRTLLWRGVAGSQAPLVFVMLNPSTADATEDDPTIRRCRGFARREGAGGIVVVNLSPWRATDPAQLELAHKDGHDVLHTDENRRAMLAARSLGAFVVAWGAGIRPWMDGAARMARTIGADSVRCFGKTKTGEPRHPLMLRWDAPLVQFP